MRLLLARHGQTEWNADRRFQGTSDISLSAVGRKQAHALGRALRGHRITAAYVSPLRRAVETAEIALADAGIPYTPIAELRELSLGDWEGCTVDEIRRQDGDPYAAWLRAPLDCPPPGSEPLPEVCERILAAVERIGAAHGDGDVLLIAHGGVISVYACHLLGCSFNNLWRLRVDNCSLTIVEPLRLVTLNDTRHLGPELQSPHFQRSEIAASSAGSAAARRKGGKAPLRGSGEAPLRGTP
jgi:broad specificity phosphatase PhoE